MDHCFSEELFLKNKTGSYLYHTYAETLPIVDYHCHLAVQEIYENKEFEDIGEMWLTTINGGLCGHLGLMSIM